MNRQDLLEKTYPPPKLNGYRAWHRNTWLLIAERTLSASAVLLYQFLIDQADFDIDHRSFGMAEIDIDQICRIFHKKSPNTVRGWIAELTRIGFIEKQSKKNWYKVRGLTRCITPGRWQGKAAEFAKKETNQSTEKIIQLIVSDNQSIESKTQSIEEMYSILTQDPDSIALGSLVVSSIIV